MRKPFEPATCPLDGPIGGFERLVRSLCAELDAGITSFTTQPACQNKPQMEVSCVTASRGKVSIEFNRPKKRALQRLALAHCPKKFPSRPRARDPDLKYLTETERMLPFRWQIWLKEGVRRCRRVPGYTYWDVMVNDQ